MATVNEMVLEFNTKFGAYIGTEPGLADPETGALRVRLIREEFIELFNAVDSASIVEVADALGDLVYVVYGAAQAWGIPLDAVVEEIHRSNMTKMPSGDGTGRSVTPITRGDGKILKGPDYVPPDIARVLRD